MSLIIRPLGLPDLENGLRETYENLSPVGDVPLTRLERIHLLRAAIPSVYRTLVAVTETQVVSTVTLLLEQKFIHEGGLAGHIEDVATRQGYERRGIARTLMARAEEVARAGGCYKMILDCAEHNVLFYKRLGYHVHEICMRKDL